MKNKALIILILIAIPLYIWDSHALLSGIFDGGRPTTKKNYDVLRHSELTLPNLVVHFENKGRSPFIAFKEKPKPIEQPSKADKKPHLPKTGLVTAQVPKISVTGIMWHPTNPIAMITLPDGSSSTIKTGQTIGGFQFKKIEKNKVLVASNGSEFWIEK
jgi:hypothetical protein